MTAINMYYSDKSGIGNLRSKTCTDNEELWLLRGYEQGISDAIHIFDITPDAKKQLIDLQRVVQGRINELN